MSDFVEVKTADLTGCALDWAVAMAEGWEADRPQAGQIRKGDIYMLVGPFRLIGLGADKFYSPSTNWSQGGPLLDEYGIELQIIKVGLKYKPYYCAYHQSDSRKYTKGNTALIAICRTVVTIKIGETVKVPTKLVNNDNT